MLGMRRKQLGTYEYSRIEENDASDNSDSDENARRLSSKIGVKVFEVNSDDESISETELVNFKSMKRSLHDGGSSVEIYEIDISGAHGSESLQKIALKYSCSIWELKRVNSLLNAQDFHALNRIRIPAMKNSYRAELLQRDGRLVNQDEISAGYFGDRVKEDEPNGHIQEEDKLSEAVEMNTELGVHRDHFFRTVSIRETIANDSESGDQFLRHMDHDLARIRETVQNMKGSLDEVTHSLTKPLFQPLSHGNNSFSLRNKFRINGVDCGITWRTIICLGVFISLVLPGSVLVYYFLS